MGWEGRGGGGGGSVECTKREGGRRLMRKGMQDVGEMRHSAEGRKGGQVDVYFADGKEYKKVGRGGTRIPAIPMRGMCVFAGKARA